MSAIMFILYSILYLLLSPLLALPLLFIFCFMPIFILNIPNLLWRASKWLLFADAPAPIRATTPTVLVSSFPKRTYKPGPKRSKMAGIRRNRAILDIARRGANATPNPPTIPN